MGLIAVLKLQEMEQKLSPMLLRTGRAGAVSTDKDAGVRETEQESFDADRDAKRKAFFSDVYSKGEIAFNKRQMETGFAANQKTANTPAWQQEYALSKAELDTPAARENIRLAFSMADAAKAPAAKNILQANVEGKLKDKSAAMDQRVDAAIEAAIQKKTADAVGASYGDTIHAKVLGYATQKLGHAPSEDELKAFSPADMNGFAQAALAELEDNNADTGRVGLAHYDSRHTKPSEADMLGRVGSAVSPDLKQKSNQTGTYNATMTDTTTGAVTTVATPVYPGTNTTTTPMPVDAAKNLRREPQTNTVSTVKSPEAGMFVIEDAMAQAWEQSMLDPSKQNLAGESQNLVYEFGQYRGPMTYEGGLGDTYSTASGLAGLGQANNSPTPFAKIKTRLDNVSVERDNPSAKLIIKQDKSRGGYDPYTMMSQVAGPTNTGMRSFTRNAPTGPIVLGADNRPATTATDWDAAAETHATRVKAGMTAQKTVATNALAAADTRKQTAAQNAQAADAAYDTDVQDNFGGSPPAGLFEAVQAGAAAAARLANLAGIKADAAKLLQDATDKVNNADARITAARTVLTNAVTAATVGPAKDAATKKLQEFEARAQDIAAHDAAAKDGATKQAKAVDDAIAAATAQQVKAEKDVAAAVTGAGLKLSDQLVIDLIAKAKTKADAGIELALATKLSAGFGEMVKTATANEALAEETLKTVQAGGIENFLGQQVTAAKAQAKADLEGKIDAAGTPDAKAAALDDMLQTAEAEAEAMQTTRGQARLEKIGKGYDSTFAAYEKQGKAEEEAKEAAELVKTLETGGASGPDHDKALDIAKQVEAAKNEELKAAEQAAKEVEAFEQAMIDAGWDMILRDEAEDARAKSERLELAATVGTAKGAAPAALNAARQTLATALKGLHSAANATAESGDQKRKAAAEIKAATRDVEALTKRVKSLGEAAAALGVATPALAKKMTAASDMLTKATTDLATAQAALQTAETAYKANTALMDTARTDVEAAEEVLKGLMPAK